MMLLTIIALKLMLNDVADNDSVEVGVDVGAKMMLMLNDVADNNSVEVDVDVE